MLQIEIFGYVMFFRDSLLSLMLVDVILLVFKNVELVQFILS